MGSLVAVVMVLLLGACSSDDDGSPSTTEAVEIASSDRSPVTAAELEPFAFSDEGMAGPGTPLGGGLTVPEGAVLLGVAFPDLVGAGYRALLLVPGEPVDVFSRVAEQAGGLGMDGDGGCVSVDGGLGCRGTFVDGADGESLAVTLRRRIGSAGVESGLSLLYRPPGTADTGTDTTEARAPADPVAPVPLPEGPIEGPTPADVAAAVRQPDAPPRTVEEGSRLVGLPGPCACDGPGWSFVVELTGVDRDVVAAYARQFSDLGDPPDISDQLRDSSTILGVRVGTSAPLAEVRAVIPDSGPAYAIVTYVGE